MHKITIKKHNNIIAIKVENTLYNELNIPKENRIYAPWGTLGTLIEMIK